MVFFRKNKLLVIFLLVLFLGGFFTKNVILAREVEDNEEIYNNSSSNNSSSNNSNTTDAKIPDYPSNIGTGIINLKSNTMTVGSIFSALLPYIYAVAGLILLFMLIMGGLGLMTAAGDPKKMEASQGRITAALIGFLIVFISYFVVQLVEIMLNIQIL